MSVKVSVIVAIHRLGLNLSQALTSLKNQSLRDIEIILIDAGTDDGTREIMEGYLSDKRFRYVRVEDSSLSLARNKGIELSQGKYIAFADKNVIYSRNTLENLYQTAEKEKADLTVAPMASCDIYGKHEFTSSDKLLRRRVIDKFDTNIIWNGAVTNKLFLKEKIISCGIEFQPYGKAREIAFTLAYVFTSSRIVACPKGTVSYIHPVSSEGASEVNIELYLAAYEYVIRKATEAFALAVEESVSDFDRKEMKKQMVCYIDQLYHKEITVLLYSYYRHFWSLQDRDIEKYAEIVTSLCQCLSDSGRRSLEEKNKDIFFDGRLIMSHKEMAENPKCTVCICDMEQEVTAEMLETCVSSLYKQTMPCFELFVHSSLRSIFPEKWKAMPNITFIDSSGSGELKDIALEKSKTGYIMYQQAHIRLNPKMLMRHYTALEGKDKYGFTTSPLSRFDGNTVSEYTFSELSYYNDISQTRTRLNDSTFALDLFFCNKLFSTKHLRGIHFYFSDNSVSDVYKLYTHSKFKKLSHRGVYFPYSEEQIIQHLRQQQLVLPVNCRSMLKKYKGITFRKVKIKKLNRRFIEHLKLILGFFLRYAGTVITSYYKAKKLKNRVFFVSSRSDGEFLENLQTVYEGYKGEKVALCTTQLHRIRNIVRIRKYLLTSKVIVTDDCIDSLRYIRLREKQRLIQVWYTGGAFRRFGLDNPDITSRLDEYKLHSQYSAVCVSSDYVRQFYSHAFGVDMDIVHATGTPRSDVVVNAAGIAEKKAEITFKHPLLKEKKVYVYFPTFREDEGELMDFDPKIDFDKLNDDLDDDEVFILCRHPFMKKEYIKDRFYPRVKDYTDDPTPELIAIADVVITDYSSIVFDTSILGKAMVFYMPDLKKHKDAFYLKHERDLPGEIITDSTNLLEALRRAPEISSRERIAEFRDKEMNMCDGKATQRVLKLIDTFMAE